ncbi:unnamed protein product [Acanthoscelides obtectus]|nr:unnamed protein product [Acanthoscelides obtectus]CAK1623740.1 hypothetical protein AOBTE_LOCUS2148 [Acanthoscelides obtectus]
MPSQEGYKYEYTEALLHRNAISPHGDFGLSNRALILLELFYTTTTTTICDVFIHYLLSTNGYARNNVHL